MAASPAQSICIVGLGLMGGSFALALRARGYRGRLTGVARSEATCHKALDRGIVDAAATDLRLVGDADVVVLCTPVRLLIAQLGHLGGLCKPGAIITDTRAVPIPSDAAPGDYHVIIGWYLNPSFERLTVDGRDATEYVVERITISAP